MTLSSYPSMACSKRAENWKLIAIESLTDTEVMSTARRVLILAGKSRDSAWLNHAADWLTTAGNVVRDERDAHQLHRTARDVRERARSVEHLRSVS